MTWTLTVYRIDTGETCYSIESSDIIELVRTVKEGPPELGYIIEYKEKGVGK